MLFKPRQRRTVLYHARNVVWPRAGWGRSFSYLRHRVARLPGSPESIAMGLTCGIAVSFTPLIGFHLVAAALIAWVLGGNLFSSALGTAIGNPWTFPPIFLWDIQVGHWILGKDDAIPEAISETTIFDNVVGVFVPTLVGSIPTALVVGVASYYPLRYIIRSYRATRRHRLERLARQRMIQRKGMMEAAAKEETS
jgi:uncharacterized protein (DUF2062 family)